MAISEADLKKVESLSKRIQRIRAVLGDQRSPYNMITRPKGQNHHTFRKRISQLRKLELQRSNLLQDLTRPG